MSIRSILVIDDCDLSQMVAQMEIEQFDPAVTILEAYDGLEALELLRRMSAQPDLIFLDINMPRMNGHEFLANYTSEFARPAMVAMLSSSGLARDRSAAAQYPCVQHYFTKPFTRNHLEHVALDAIRCVRGETTAPAPQIQADGSVRSFRTLRA